MTILEILGLIWLALIIYFIFEAYFCTQYDDEFIQDRKIQYTSNGEEILFEDDIPLSSCCGYFIIEGTDICSNKECLEHTGIHNI